ncbi:MAG TPA: UDP-3-O-acyl-N-acetylglucosamine deacetylase [Phycisphaerales bacterium]|nr:UDP-3-O-acyl-N-acetylglucosamine deacetylase [Phycisphaerales bacterium]
MATSPSLPPASPVPPIPSALPAHTPGALQRRTLSRVVTLEGVTLFTGVRATLDIAPVPQHLLTRQPRSEEPIAGVSGANKSVRGGIFFEARPNDRSPSCPAFFADIRHIATEARRTVLSSVGVPLSPPLAGSAAAATPARPSAQAFVTPPAGTPSATPASVQTVEHVLSALMGLGVTDALLTLTGPEVPLLDGSSIDFVRAIDRAGLVTLSPPAPANAALPAHDRTSPIIIRERLEITDDKDPTVRIVAEPLSADEEARGVSLVLRYELDYRLETTGLNMQQAFEWAVPSDPVKAAAEYRELIAPARTFCTLAEAQAMRAKGMFTHLTAREMLVLRQDTMGSGEGGGGVEAIDNDLRYPDEPARHKVLDLLGDLALVGGPGGSRRIVGRITATRTGHHHNHQMARLIVLRAT